MKKYILLVIILCVGLISCERDEREFGILPHTERMCDFRFAIVDKEGNNILANDIEELGDFTVEFDDWVFDMKDDWPKTIYVGRKEESGPYSVTIYSNIISYDNGKIKTGRFSWSAWWGDYQTFTIKYCDCEWNVVCDAIGDRIANTYDCDAVWIDGVESEPVYMGTTSDVGEIWAYELRMK